MKNLLILLRISLSKILELLHRFATGLQFSITCLQPLLCTGMIFDNRHCCRLLNQWLHNLNLWLSLLSFNGTSPKHYLKTSMKMAVIVPKKISPPNLSLARAKKRATKRATKFICPLNYQTCLFKDKTFYSGLSLFTIPF